MSLALSLLAGVVIVLVITAATAYFVAQEFAYLAVDRSALAARAEHGDASARRTLGITRRTSFMLSGAQLGITVTGLLVGYVAEPLIGVALADVIERGGLTMGLSLAIGSVVALSLSTVVQMLFGELFPKNYAIARADQVAGALSRSTAIYLRALGPLIWIFDKAAELLLRTLRMEPVHDVDHAASAADLEHVVARSRDRGDLTPEMSHVLDRILDFPTRDVAHALRPRTGVDIVRPAATLAAVRHLMGSGHTRYPVLDEDERIVGVVHLVDVLSAYAAGRPVTDPVTALMRPPLIIPTAMPLPAAHSAMSNSDAELACVVDEYGGFAGILTLEDLAEEIVGELSDEHDPDQDPATPRPDGQAWLVPGDTRIDEIERTLDVDLPDSDAETIAGLVLETCGALPEVGERVAIPLPCDPAAPHDAHRILRADVVSIERYVPAQLRLHLEAATDVGERSGGANPTEAADGQAR